MVFSFTSRNSTCNEHHVSYVVTRVCETKGNNLNTYLNMMLKSLTLNAVIGLKLTSRIRDVDLANADPVKQEAFKHTKYDTSLWVLSGWIPFFRPQALLQRDRLPSSAILSTIFKCGSENRTLTAVH